MCYCILFRGKTKCFTKIMKSASTPRTTSGKICKICSKKGSPCHLHTSGTSGGTSRIASGVVKSVSSKKPAKKFNLEDLPIPALQQVLLNISDERKLHQICTESRKAAKVCRAPEFKKMYNAKYKRLFVGRITKSARTGFALVYIFRDEAVNTLFYIKKGIGAGTIFYVSKKMYVDRNSTIRHKGFSLDLREKRLRYVEYSKASTDDWNTFQDASEWWQRNLFVLLHSIDPEKWPTKESVTFESVFGEIKRHLSSFKIDFNF